MYFFVFKQLKQFHHDQKQIYLNTKLSSFIMGQKHLESGDCNSLSGGVAEYGRSGAESSNVVV